MQTKKYIQLLAVFLLILSASVSFGQACEADGLHQKYELYKQRYYRHFIAMDRSERGCVNDGIGLILSQDSTQVNFEKQGFGLPATNLWIAPNGAGLVGGRLNNRMDRDCNNFGISWSVKGEDVHENPNHKFNWLEFGSETLSELGWWFVTLATEYEIERREGDVEGQQKTLEEIFLSLQALRRLDMQAQYILDRAYANRRGGDLICDKKQALITKAGWWNNCHRNWDVRVKEDADFKPDYSGYNGFLIRADAGQNLEERFHDPTDEAWHVDAIGGAFGALVPTPGSPCPVVDSLCYMVRSQFFLSHDQIMNLFYGLLFVKKYVPATASIQTCDGQKYYPVEMMQKIAKGIMMAIDAKRITVPGSKENCRHAIRLSECEGGDLRPTIYGLKSANAILQGKKVKSSGWERSFFKSMSIFSGGFNGEFYAKQASGFRDLSVNKKKNRRVIRLAQKNHKEILLLGNDLLFPKGQSVAEKVGGDQFFKKMLCTAPVDGPCHVPDGYKDNWPWGGGDIYWPNFDCTNIPGWEGSRWQSLHIDDKGFYSEWLPPRRTNGLDYMALYNMYVLMYGR